MNIIKRVALTCLTSGLFLVAGTANAATISGKITSIFVSSINNLPFRLALDTPMPAGCNGTLYVDGASGNYQVYVSALMLAYSQGKDLDITYSVEPNGFCSIAEFRVR